MFGRSGDNLTVSVPVTITELALGADIKVPTHRGPAVTLRIKPGSANVTVMRVPGRGVRRKDGTMGDLRATLEVMVPQDRLRDALHRQRPGPLHLADPRRRPHMIQDAVRLPEPARGHDLLVINPLAPKSGLLAMCIAHG